MSHMSSITFSSLPLYAKRQVFRMFSILHVRSCYRNGLNILVLSSSPFNNLRVTMSDNCHYCNNIARTYLSGCLYYNILYKCYSLPPLFFWQFYIILHSGK